MNEPDALVEKVLNDKATVKDVSVQASVGGRLQLVKFEASSDYHFSMSRTYSVEDMTEEEADTFQKMKTQALRANVEEIAQKELDELYAQREELNAS